MTERSEGIDLRRLVRKQRPNRQKPPPGWRVRCGAMIGHGQQEVKVVAPDGFRFTKYVWAEGARETVISQLWQRHDAEQANN